jgi:hypothetical protein
MDFRDFHDVSMVELLATRENPGAGSIPSVPQDVGIEPHTCGLYLWLKYLTLFFIRSHLHGKVTRLCGYHSHTIL